MGKIILDSPELDAVLQMRHHQCQVEKGSLLLTFWQCSSKSSQDTVANMLRVHSGPSSKSLMKMLDSIDTWGSCFQLDFDQLITSLAWSFSQFSVDLRVHLGIGEGLDKGLLAHVTSELKVLRMQKHFPFHFRESSFFNKMTSPEDYKANK